MTKENQGKPVKIKSSFIRRNLVTLVMIPSLIALHWGWHELQQNEIFVKKEERVDLPIVIAAKYMWKKVQGNVDK